MSGTLRVFPESFKRAAIDRATARGLSAGARGAHRRAGSVDRASAITALTARPAWSARRWASVATKLAAFRNGVWRIWYRRPSFARGPGRVH